MLRSLFFFACLVLTSAEVSASNPSEFFLQPKMVAQPADARRKLADRPGGAALPPTPSKASLVPGSCAKGASTFDFALSSGSGHGIVCVVVRRPLDDVDVEENENDTSSLSRVPFLELQTPDDEPGFVLNYAGDRDKLPPFQDCLGLPNRPDASTTSMGWPFLFQDISPHGTKVQVLCPEDIDEEIDFVVVVMDSVNEQEGIVLSEYEGANDETKEGGNAMVHPELLDPVARIESVHVETFLRQTNRTMTRIGAFDDDTNGDVRLPSENDDVVSVLQYQVVDAGGNTYQRTHVSFGGGSNNSPLPLFDLEIASHSINEVGDLEIALSGLPRHPTTDGNDDDDDENDDHRWLCHVRLGLEYVKENESSASTEDRDSWQTVSLVDVSAMLHPLSPVLVIHGGWVRVQLEELGLLYNDNDALWDLVVQESLCENPNKEYRLEGVMPSEATKNDNHRRLLASRNRHLLRASRHHSRKLQNHERRHLLAREPTDEERAISVDMKMGRPPITENKEMENLGHRRQLIATRHRCILIHGWCSDGNTWPGDKFTGPWHEVVKFYDPGKNYNHDEFARSIGRQSCHYLVDPHTGTYISGNIIGHSQAGAASTHLYNFYWSCLDRNTNPGKLIQSVGTPYQGTNLAGAIALIGDVLGIGCGRNGDMTEGGAASWLGRLSSWAKSRVTYYRTRYKERGWWSYDYCNAAVHAVLGWPDDGTVEVERGVLPGGVDGGVTSEQCHSRNMRDPPQIQDSARNSHMRNAAAVPRSAPPTPHPTNRPTPVPTHRPTPLPTNRPTPVPTNWPTPLPTNRPTPVPTNRPTPLPTHWPTPIPTYRPTPAPTNRPTVSPSDRPTPLPTFPPSPEPTMSPTTFSPTTFSPTTYSPTTFSPTTFSPSTFSPTTFSPTTFSPTTFSPTTLVPSTSSPFAALSTSLSPTTMTPSTTPPSDFPSSFPSDLPSQFPSGQDANDEDEDDEDEDEDDDDDEDEERLLRQE